MLQAPIQRSISVSLIIGTFAEENWVLFFHLWGVFFFALYSFQEYIQLDSDCATVR